MSDKKKKWTSKEEADMMKLISENKTLDQISKKIKKSNKVIIYKLKKIANKMSTTNTKEEIFEKLKLLTIEQINKIVEQQKKKKNIKEFAISHSVDLSEFGINNNKKSDIIQNNNSGSDLDKIYKMLININQKVNNIENLCVLNAKKSAIEVDNKSNSKHTDSSSVKSSIKNIDLKIKSEQTSPDTSGEDTDEIMNLIQTKTNNLINAKKKYINEMVK